MNPARCLLPTYSPACPLGVALGVALLVLTPRGRCQDDAAGPRAGYQETWESLSRHPVPEWFADAKLGIYAHWGVYSVPAFGNEWYPRNMYRQDSATFAHHVARYGSQAVFGYKDFIPMFRAEKFDAEAWAELYAAAGAKFAGPVAEHHDGFSMWASRVNRWNAADMGPERDVTGELVAALRRRGLKIVASFHHAFNIQGYYAAAAGWDTADPRYGDLYGQFADQAVAHERWLRKIEEVIDAYRPDQIWFDFGLAKIPDAFKRKMAARYYNQEAVWQAPVIITRKGDHLPDGVGVLDIERGKMAEPAPFLWQTDDSVATNSWCWVEGLLLKPAEELVHELCDIVSKNGVLLLNVAPKADGTFPDDQRALLREIGAWLRQNGAGIYGTRPWLVHGEGPNLYDRGRGLGAGRQEQVRFDGRDVRFTRSKDGGSLYAIFLGWPERPARSVTLDSVRVDAVERGAGVRLIGHDGSLEHRIDRDGRLAFTVPALDETQWPGQHAFVFEVHGFRLGLQPSARFRRPGASALLAEHAVLEGERIATEQRGGRTAIGFWDDPHERVHWLVRVRRAGRHALRSELAAAAGATRVAVDVGDQSIVAAVPRAAGWDDARFVDLGEIEFARPGVYHLVLRAADPSAWRPVNVWQVQLAPLD